MNTPTDRGRLHYALITRQDLSCPCGSRDRREIHRIVPGGPYSSDNTEVRCFGCHHQLHSHTKFRLGSRVIVNGRAPAYIALERGRPRTVVSVRYDQQHQCNYYKLGSNGRGDTAGDGNPLNGIAYEFRSYMLLPYQPRRYHHIRKYHRHHLDTISCDGQGAEQAPEAIEFL